MVAANGIQNTNANLKKKARLNFILTFVFMAIFLALMFSGKMLNGSMVKEDSAFLKVGEEWDKSQNIRLTVTNMELLESGWDSDALKAEYMDENLEPAFAVIVYYEIELLNGEKNSFEISEVGTAKEDGFKISKDMVNLEVISQPENKDNITCYTEIYGFRYAADTVQAKFIVDDNTEILHNIYITHEFDK